MNAVSTRQIRSTELQMFDEKQNNQRPKERTRGYSIHARRDDGMLPPCIIPPIPQIQSLSPPRLEAREAAHLRWDQIRAEGARKNP